jgi:hypothetical protein
MNGKEIEGRPIRVYKYRGGGKEALMAKRPMFSAKLPKVK